MFTGFTCRKSKSKFSASKKTHRKRKYLHYIYYKFPIKKISTNIPKKQREESITEKRSSKIPPKNDQCIVFSKKSDTLRLYSINILYSCESLRHEHRNQNKKEERFVCIPPSNQAGVSNLKRSWYVPDFMTSQSALDKYASKSTHTDACFASGNFCFLFIL